MVNLHQEVQLDELSPIVLLAERAEEVSVSVLPQAWLEEVSVLELLRSPGFKAEEVSDLPQA